MTTKEEADAFFEKALDMLAEAYEWNGIRTGHLLLVDGQRMNSDGTSSTVMGYHTPDGQPWTETLGIMRVSTLRLEKDFITAEREDE